MFCNNVVAELVLCIRIFARGKRLWTVRIDTRGATPDPLLELANEFGHRQNVNIALTAVMRGLTIDSSERQRWTAVKRGIGIAGENVYTTARNLGEPCGHLQRGRHLVAWA